MLDIKKILVPMDFSHVNRRAVYFALVWAQERDGELHLVAVDKTLEAEVKERIVNAPLGTAVDDHISETDREMHRMVDEAYAQAEAARRDAGDRRQVLKPRVRTHLVGNTGLLEACLETCREQGIDLIVAGTHGRRTTMDSWRGTITERLVEEAPCHVFVVKPEGYPIFRD